MPMLGVGSGAFRCPRCGEITSGAMNNCPECGQSLTIDCPECGRTWRHMYEHKFCPNCGKRVTQSGGRGL